MMIFGIDPGIQTGVAVFKMGKLTELKTIQPWQLPSLLAQKPDRVIFEDSRKQSFLWTTTGSRAAALKMARNVGQIDAWAALIEGLCADLGIECNGISPSGKGAKLNAESFEKVTGWTERSNQHERDSAMVAWRYRYAGID